MMQQAGSYIICATPRSGSTLLCDLLADTGVAGRPNSFFRRQSFVSWADRFGVAVATWTDGAGGTGVFGMRVMWESLGDLADRLDSLYPGLASDTARFQAAFGTRHYIHLSRNDKIAQAISLVRAEQSGLWHVGADGTERERVKPGQPPSYDASRLSRYVAKLTADDAAWARWFAAQGIQPVRVGYEALAAHPHATLATVLSALDLDPTLASGLQPRTAKLADGESREWVVRFRNERSP